MVEKYFQLNGKKAKNVINDLKSSKQKKEQNLQGNNVIGIEKKMFGKVVVLKPTVLAPILIIKPHTPYSVVRQAAKAGDCQSGAFGGVGEIVAEELANTSLVNNLLSPDAKKQANAKKTISTISQITSLFSASATGLGEFAGAVLGGSAQGITDTVGTREAREYLLQEAIKGGIQAGAGYGAQRLFGFTPDPKFTIKDYFNKNYLQKLIETGSSIGAGSLITNEEFGLDNDYYLYNLDDLIEAGISPKMLHWQSPALPHNRVRRRL